MEEYYDLDFICEKCGCETNYKPNFVDMQNAQLHNFYFTCKQCGSKTNLSAMLVHLYGTSFDSIKEKCRLEMFKDKQEEFIPPSPLLKLSYLIAFATKALEEHGDLEVYAGHEGQVTQLKQKDIEVDHPYMYVDPSAHPLAFVINADGL